VHHNRGGEIPDDLDGAVPEAGIDTMEVGPAQAAPRRVEIDATYLGDTFISLEQLGDPGTEFASHAGDEDPHGCSGRSLRVLLEHQT
jgi:hypothetical protein